MPKKSRRTRWERLLPTLWAGFLVRSGLLFLFRLFQRPRLLVLAYHRVTPPEKASHWEMPQRYVSTETFAKQLRALRPFYRFVSLEEFQEIVTGKKRVHRHVALVTFDDGYRDNYEHALPILRNLRVPAAFFISLGFVGDRRSFWFDRLAQACGDWEKGETQRARLHSLLPPPLAAILEAAKPWGERLRQALEFVARLPVQERRALLKRLLPGSGLSEQASEALSWTEVRALRAAGMSVGAHGRTHTTLVHMSATEARRELQESLQGVARGAEAPVVAFAYPAGATDEDVTRWARDAGVEIAFTLEPRENRPGDDPLRLGRHNVCEDTSRDAFDAFSTPVFVGAMTGMLGLKRQPEAHAFPAGAALLELAWTGPQEAGSRHETLEGPPAARLAQESEPPTPRRGLLQAAARLPEVVRLRPRS